MSAPLDLKAAVEELRDIASRASELADLLDASPVRPPREPVQPEVGEVVERGPSIDAEIKFGDNSLADF